MHAWIKWPYAHPPPARELGRRPETVELDLDGEGPQPYIVKDSDGTGHIRVVRHVAPPRPLVAMPAHGPGCPCMRCRSGE